MRNFKRLYTRLIFISIAAGLLMTIGCAPGNVTVKGMVPDQLQILERHEGAVSLMVNGGRDKHLMNLPMIPNTDFMAALKTAVEQSQIFSQVAEKGGAEYQLKAFIFNLSQPMFIRDKVSVEIAWTFSRADTGEVVWQEAITTPGSGMASKDATYDKRVATEQAANENIKQAIEQLSKISF